jgi:hypothetical protein
MGRLIGLAFYQMDGMTTHKPCNTTPCAFWQEVDPLTFVLVSTSCQRADTYSTLSGAVDIVDIYIDLDIDYIIELVNPGQVRNSENDVYLVGIAQVQPAKACWALIFWPQGGRVVSCTIPGR